jgi:hypothetical protein
LKIQESTGTPNSQSESSLENVRVHSLTLSFTPRLPFGSNLASPCLGHEPKARVVTKVLMGELRII